MNKQALDQMWDFFRQKYGVYLRLLESIPEDRYHTNPVPGMRTPAELAVHTSATCVRDVAEGIAKGAITADEGAEARLAAELRSKAALIEFAKDCWKRADAAVAKTGDAQLSAIVSTPWDISFPGWVGFNMLSDEFLHHRGQLAVFARACGGAPPFIWGFEDNAPEFRPAH